MTSFTRHLAAAAACAALTLPVWAQTTPAAPATPDATATTLPANASQRANRQAKRQQWQEKRAERHAAHLEKLKQQLALTPEQEPAWAKFALAMQPPSNTARPNRQEMDQLTTPERIERMRTLRAEHNTAMDARMDATKAFYAELQPAQQHSFDLASAKMMHGQRKGHHPMQGRMGHGMHAPAGQPSAQPQSPAN